MTIIADTHVHLYPCYDLPAALRNLNGNLRKIGGDSVRTAFLAERFDCHYFRDLKQGLIKISGEDLKILPADEDNAVVLIEKDEPVLYLFAGRQIVTVERVEILALTVDTDIPDNLPAEETVTAVLDAGGLPVLSWAPGKWFFKRAGTVRGLIDKFSPDSLLIGDTTLRPTIWPEPCLMRLAERQGFGVVAGSDPLPFQGEEKRLGTYGSILDGRFDPDKPVTSVRKMLITPGTISARAGKRCGALTVLCRLQKNAAVSENPT